MVPLAVIAIAGVVVGLVTLTDSAGFVGAGTVAPTDVTVPVGIVGKVARLPSPLTYSDVVPLAVIAIAGVVVG
ncbi:MAG: hypothetical protein ACK559_34820, partial [bacterium]